MANIGDNYKQDINKSINHMFLEAYSAKYNRMVLVDLVCHLHHLHKRHPSYRRTRLPGNSDL